MAWKYCRCGQGLREATAEEDLDKGQTCTHCGRRQSQEKTIEEWIINLDDRLRELEKKND